MVDFNSDGPEEPTESVTNLNDLYASLDRKSSHVSPRQPQIEAFNELSNRRQDRDIVLKMSTGYGKTAVALVYLYSHMLETGSPVAYLCPTTQLVDQVLREATNLGIKASYYAAQQRYPEADAAGGKAIIVCTYDKLFNAKTTFNRDDVDIIPYAIALDDAHSGLQEVRDAFTIRITLKDHGPLFQEMIDLLRSPCKNHEPGIWEGIEREDEGAFIEVPFWIWAPLVKQLQPLLESRYGEESEDKDKQKKALLFQWGYLREHLRWCRCFVSGVAIEILPDVPPVHLVRPYAKAKHRLFMSGTISDDSALVRELGCSSKAALTPIVPPSDAGVGERMILTPHLIDPSLNRAWVMQWCKALSASVRVVVLTANENASKEWAQVGATAVVGNQVNSVVDQLRAGQASFAAFAQRYDGIDLPDDACRVLVLDGMPIGQGLADNHDRRVPGRTGGTYRKWIYRVEQGMGRAVRSQADYAVIIITGLDLVTFLSKRDTIDHMGTATRAQLEASEKLTRLARSDKRPPEKVVHETALQSLSRDPQWRSFYEKNVKKKIGGHQDKPDELQIQVADIEQQAQKLALTRDAPGAAKLIGDLINSSKLTAEQIGWLLQRKANYVYDYNQADAIKIQAAAFEKNDRMCTPPVGTVTRKAKSAITAPGIILAWYSAFEHPNGAIAEFAELKTRLSFDVKPYALEDGLERVAKIFGADGSRPEKLYRRGPDDLWEWPGIVWVIEAKNDEKSELSKDDAGQLQQALAWLKETMPEAQETPIIVARTAVAEYHSFFPNNTRVLTPSGLNSLVANIDNFLTNLTQKESSAWSPGQIAQLLAAHKLSYDQFSGAYTEPISRSHHAPGT